MERTTFTLTIIFANIRTSKSTYYSLNDISHSKTHTTIIPFPILLQILASPTKNRKKTRFQFKNRKKQEYGQKIGKNRNWTPCNLFSKSKVQSRVQSIFQDIPEIDKTKPQGDKTTQQVDKTTQKIDIGLFLTPIPLHNPVARSATMTTQQPVKAINALLETEARRSLNTSPTTSLILLRNTLSLAAMLELYVRRRLIIIN